MNIRTRGGQVSSFRGAAQLILAELPGISRKTSDVIVVLGMALFNAATLRKGCNSRQFSATPGNGERDEAVRCRRSALSLAERGAAENAPQIAQMTQKRFMGVLHASAGLPGFGFRPALTTPLSEGSSLWGDIYKACSLFPLKSRQPEGSDRRSIFSSRMRTAARTGGCLAVRPEHLVNGPLRSSRMRDEG